MSRFCVILAFAVIAACAPKPPHDTATPTPRTPAATSTPAPRGAPQTRFAFDILEHDTPPSMMADSVTVVMLKLKNTSSRDWPKDGPFKLGYYWQDEKGNEIEKLGGRARPQKDVPAGQMAFFKARVQAPLTPGTYYLVWDMVEEQVAWFSKKGASPVKVAVAVR